MTPERKQDIRLMAIQVEKAIGDRRKKSIPIDDFRTLLAFILKLTEPDTFPPTTGKEESQEELLDELASMLIEPILLFAKDGKDKPYDTAMDKVLSRFTLTRKPA